MSGAEPWHRLEHRREFALGVDIAGRRDADGAGAGRAEVGEDVAEQVRRHHDVEAVRVQHEQRRQDVDVKLVPLDVGEVLRHRLHALVPVRHVMAMPFDLVADVRCFFGVLRASSKANFNTRSTPTRLSTVSCITISRSVPGHIRPPIAEYSPSVFSRTTQKSMSPGFLLASGDGTPGIRRTGRRLTYWSNSRRNWISEPHSEM